MKYLLVLLSSLFLSLSVQAGVEPNSDYRVVITHPLAIYDGGSIEEAIELSTQWRDKVLLKNPHMNKVDYLIEKQSDVRYMLMVIYYYQSQESAKLANQQIPKLIEQAWPDVEKRKAFFNKLQSYVVQAEKETYRFKPIL